MPNDAPATANRRTRLSVDISETTVGRREWGITRTAAEIFRDSSARSSSAPKSEKVWAVGGGEAWILAPRGTELAELTENDAADSVIGASDVTLGTGTEAMQMWRRADDLPGIGANANSAAAAWTAFVRTVQAGASWALGNLAADVAAFPQVPGEADGGQYPLDRILSGTKTYHQRAPFALRWYIPDDFVGSDSFACFYFGGPADVTPDGAHGGQFALSLRGSGEARLFEYDPSEPSPAEQWERRMIWQFSDPGASKGRFETLFVVPYARNRIEFRSVGVSFPDYGGGSIIGPTVSLMIAGMSAKRPATHMWKDLPAYTGHSHIEAVTGAGTVRLDLARNQRVPVGLAQIKFPSTDNDENGVIVDAPFFIPYILDADTPITARTTNFLPDNTSVAISLFDAATDDPLSVDDDGNFLSVADQQFYYAKIALASVDGTQTPVFWNYSVNVDVEYQENERTPNTAAFITRVSTESAGIDPTSELANIQISDLLNACPILRQRDGIRSMLSVYTSSNAALVSNLMEGETMSPVSKKRGKDGEVFPSSNWRDVDLRMTGIWSRLACQFPIAMINFADDPDAPPQPGGKPVPWRAVDAIRKLFHMGGVPDEELDLPGDIDIRFWPVPEGDGSVTTYELHPGIDLASAIRRIAWDFLRMTLVRDVNCRSGALEGKWRLIRNPSPPYDNVVASFHITDPGTLSGKLSHMLASYPEGESYVEDYEDWPVRPECNFLRIQGWDPIANQAIEQVAINRDSIEDPDHPDYLGYMLECNFPVDPTLTSQEAVDWATQIVYEAAAHAQKWCSFTAPLMFVTDTEDDQQVRPRPLRINDIITVAGLPALVRRCDISIETDVAQRMTVEALFVNDTVAIGAPDATETIRKQVASLVAANSGERAAPQPPVFKVQVGTPQAMAHHRALPINPNTYAAIQNTDGSFKYSLDFSPLDGAPLG